MRPYLLFIVMILGGLAFTAAISNILDTRLADQEMRRQETHLTNRLN